MAVVSATVESEGRTLEISGVRTVLGLLHKLGRKPARTLIIRREAGGRRLLTPDMPLADGDRIVVRDVSSRG